MIYSDLYQRKQIRIPSIFAILVIGVLSFFMTQFFLTPSRSTNATKRNILSMKIANVGSRRATVLWRTTNKEVGMVIWGTGRTQLDHVTLDERDSAQNRAEYFNHSVQLTELAPNTRYYFSLSNTKELLETAGTTTFSLSTTPNDSRMNSLKPVYGTVTSAGGVMEKNVLVLFEYPGAYPLATLSKPSGEWLIPLNALTRTKGTSLIAPSLSDLVTVTFYDELGNTSTVYSPIELLSPVNQPVRMGKQYRLPEESQVLGTNSAQLVIAQSTPSPTQDAQGSLSVLYPTQNAVLSVGSPLIKGKAAPHAIVSLSVRSMMSTAVVINRTSSTDRDGMWKLSLTQLLPAGDYTLTAKIEGSYTSITRVFSVAKSGERVLGEATGSATLTTTPTSTPTATPSDEPQPTLPKTGTTNDYLIYSSAAFIIMGLGLFFLL